MTAPQHHLDPSLLMASSAGALSPGLSLIAACHAALCPQCGREHAVLDDLGGALLSKEHPVDLGDDALTRALGRLDGILQEPHASKSSAGEWPAPLGPLVEAALVKHGWQTATVGIRTLPLTLDGAWPNETVELMRIEPHRGAPRHGHKGAEWTLVLRGLYQDQSGRYGPGDVAFADEDVVHTPRAGAGEVCFALAVTTGPLAFKGMTGVLQRLASRFSGR